VAVVVMIETVKGVEHVDEIAQVPGVDVLYVGPGDLALSLGVPLHPQDRTPEEAGRHAEAVERVRASCERTGKVAGIHTGDGQTARQYAEEGFQMVTVVSDMGLIAAGGRRELAVVRSLKPSSDSPV
jgi:4-hydroxy-2-oxoheptanedioate aldolase